MPVTSPIANTPFTFVLMYSSISINPFSLIFIPNGSIPKLSELGFIPTPNNTLSKVFTLFSPEFSNSKVICVALFVTLFI